MQRVQAQGRKGTKNINRSKEMKDKKKIQTKRKNTFLNISPTVNQPVNEGLKSKISREDIHQDSIWDIP